MLSLYWASISAADSERLYILKSSTDPFKNGSPPVPSRSILLRPIKLLVRFILRGTAIVELITAVPFIWIVPVVPDIVTATLIPLVYTQCVRRSHNRFTSCSTVDYLKIWTALSTKKVLKRDSLKNYELFYYIKNYYTKKMLS